METKKRALGKGLEQLFNNEYLDLQSFEKHVYETTNKEEIIELYNPEDLPKQQEISYIYEAIENEPKQPNSDEDAR